MNKIEITWNKKCPQRLGTGGGGPAPGRLGSRGGGPLGGLAGGGPCGGTDGGPPPNSNGGGRLGTCGGPGSSLFVGVALPLSVSVLEEFEMLRLRAVGGIFLCRGDVGLTGLSGLEGLTEPGGEWGAVILVQP